MASEGLAVYCTLLLSDHYLPGAMVLAHSLRDNGSSARLAALYTPESLQADTVNELRTIYDELIPVNATTNGTPANLWLMDRPDLISAFTKIELWRQTQYRRIVFLDCDIVAIRAPDELLSLDVDFAAAPDVGWPDCFNSGVMVLRPNMQDYYALKALADRGISFDGADQGLLNEHFRDWHRLSFTYNCTPSANYQYIPAYRHFQSTISLIHFIGPQKPWAGARQVDPVDAPYNQLLGRWWAIYDKHYRPVEVLVQQINREDVSAPPLPHSEPRYQLGHWEPPHKHHQPDQPYQPQHQPEPQPEYRPGQSHYQLGHREPHTVHHTSETSWEPGPTHHVILEPTAVALSAKHVHVDPQECFPTGHTQAPVYSVVPRYVRGEEHVSAYIERPHQMHHVEHAGQHWGPEPGPGQQDSCHHTEPIHTADHHGVPVVSQPEQTFEAPKVEWDAAREPPPLNTKPEGISLQRQTYTMSDDTHLFKPPSVYPEAPKDMYYQVPEKKPEPKKLNQVFPWESRAPKPTRVFLDDGQSLGSAHGKYSVPPTKDEGPVTEPYPPEEPTDAWENYSRSNAWDEVPEIQKYIQNIQQGRKAKTQVISPTRTEQESTKQAASPDTSVKLTDFPSEVERPSLPVTPAPIRRPSVWNRTDETPAELPAAEGVPNQEEWNPLARLEELRRRQSDVLDNPDSLLRFSSMVDR